MKWSDIKEFPLINYTVDVSWITLDEWVEEETANGLILDPSFQRGYVWSEYQKVAYIEYQLRGGISGKDIYFNHPYWMESSRTTEGTLELVDGKQRLNAVREFMNNEIRAFGLFFKEFEGPFLWSNYTLRFHIAKIKERKDLLKWYISMNTGGSIHTEEDIQPAYEELEKLAERRGI